MTALATETKLLIISRDSLLAARQLPSSDKVFRILAGLSRKGLHILLSAPEPDRWVPTRGNVDNALNHQHILMKQTVDAGGALEGVYYVPRSLLTQDRNREGALRDIIKRFSVLAQETVLISSSSPFIKAALRLEIEAYEIALPNKRGLTLINALESLRTL
ncbi:MAG: hypothetical protein ACI9CB_001724 [Rhodothermales bacterium]|jgi:hypothetical protein